jgi:hypothetical protein
MTETQLFSGTLNLVVAASFITESPIQNKYLLPKLMVMGLKFRSLQIANDRSCLSYIDTLTL